MKNTKILINVLIENDRLYRGEFNTNQKATVLINKVCAELNIKASGRILRREDSTPIADTTKTIEQIGIYDRETLRFIVESDKPNRDERFA